MEIRGSRGIAAICVAGLVAVGAAGASAKTFVAPATAGPPSSALPKQLDYDGFYPSTIVIHKGDSVRWAINGFHSVIFPAPGQGVLPLAMLTTGNPITGKLDGAGSPFWFNGQQNIEINPAVAFPSGGTTVDGKHEVNSGLPAGQSQPPPFTARFITLGTFKYYCPVHPGQVGTIKVVAAGKSIPSAGQDKAAAKKQAAADLKSARRLAKVNPPVATVFAGHDKGNVAWLRFFPSNLNIKAGTTVTFSMSAPRETHTITIGPASYTAPIDGTFTMPVPNPSGPPTILLNPLGAYPSDPPPLPPFTGANHGNGFEGTGVLSTSSPFGTSSKITFTKPGVYHYECVIHQGMDGTITVT